MKVVTSVTPDDDGKTLISGDNICGNHQYNAFTGTCLGVSFMKASDPLKNGSGIAVKTYIECDCPIDFGNTTHKVEVYCAKDVGTMEDLRYKLENMGNFY